MNLVADRRTAVIRAKAVIMLEIEALGLQKVGVQGLGFRFRAGNPGSHGTNHSLLRMLQVGFLMLLYLPAGVRI